MVEPPRVQIGPHGPGSQTPLALRLRPGCPLLSVPLGSCAPGMAGIAQYAHGGLVAIISDGGRVVPSENRGRRHLRTCLGVAFRVCVCSLDEGRAKTILAFSRGMLLSLMHRLTTKPQEAEDSPDTTPRRHKIAPRWTQVAPKTPEDNPKMAQPLPTAA